MYPSSDKYRRYCSQLAHELIESPLPLSQAKNSKRIQLRTLFLAYTLNLANGKETLMNKSSLQKALQSLGITLNSQRMNNFPSLKGIPDTECALGFEEFFLGTEKLMDEQDENIAKEMTFLCKQLDIVKNSIPMTKEKNIEDVIISSGSIKHLLTNVSTPGDNSRLALQEYEEFNRLLETPLSASFTDILRIRNSLSYQRGSKKGRSPSPAIRKSGKDKDISLQNYHHSVSGI